MRLLQLKLKRLHRTIKEMPLIAFLFFIAMSVGAVWILFHQFTRSPNTYIIWGFASLILLSVHRGRRDFDFCRLVMQTPKKLFAAEYLLCFAPFIILSLVTQTYVNTILYLLSSVSIALLPIEKATTPLKRMPPFLHINSLELVSFVRARFVVIVLMVSAATIFSFAPGVSILILVVFVFIMNYAYTESEPLNMLLLPELPPVKFLIHKIASGFTFFMKLSAPALLLYAVFNPGTFWLVVIPVVFALVGIALYVFVKYSLYRVDGKQITVPLIVSLGMLGLIVPMLLPFTLIMTWSYYHRAKENLNRYLYVYNN
jgi:hypothetical protein